MSEPHFLHVVINLDTKLNDNNDIPYKVDYDSKGYESVSFNGSDSHTHETGRILEDYVWIDENDTVISTDVVMGPINYSVGNHHITLIILDDNTPSDALAGTQHFNVVSSNNVPGLFVYYYKDQINNGLLYGNINQNPNYASVDFTLSVNSIPFSSNTIVRFFGKMNFEGASGDSHTYTVQTDSTYDHTFYIDGVQTNVVSSYGEKLVDFRFYVNTISNLPITITIQKSDPLSNYTPLMSHSETDIIPILNKVSNAVKINPNNELEISGYGFLPSDNFIINWGSWQLTPTFVGPNSFKFVIPNDTGLVNLNIEVRGKTSNTLNLQYDAENVPIAFNVKEYAIGSPLSCGKMGPDGKLYVGSTYGNIYILTFDDNYNVTNVQTITAIKNLTNNNILGLTFNPYDDSSPVRLYIAHSQLFANNGSGPVTSFSPYSGSVSILTGPNFDTVETLISGLPVSNHDHGINGMEFDNKGDLLICVGGNTNAGVPDNNIGGLSESPLSGAMLIAETSKQDFNGHIQYVEFGTTNINNDQRYGLDVNVMSGVDVKTYATGLRNTFDLVYTVDENIFCTDNDANSGFGPKSLTFNTQGNDNFYSSDKIIHVMKDKYHGHPNRNRGHPLRHMGALDNYENKYREYNENSDANYNKYIGLVDKSTNGIDEYRSYALDGQLYGNLIIQKWNSYTSRIILTPDKLAVDSIQQFLNLNCLGVTLGPGGTIIGMSHSNSNIKFAQPIDNTIYTKVFDIFPYRAKKQGGYPFTISGQNFSNIGTTTVSFDGKLAQLTEVTNNRIRGIVPACDLCQPILSDIFITTNGVNLSLPQSFRYLIYSSGTTPPPPVTPIDHYYINTGELNSQYVDASNNMWLVDNYYSGGKTYTVSNTINGTNDGALYQTERFGQNLSYTFPNLDNTKTYKVYLHFAEIYWDLIGKRVFNVAINGIEVLSNYDILTEVPKFTAVIKSFDIVPINGNIVISMTTVTDNAKISAIGISIIDIPVNKFSKRINSGELNSTYVDGSNNTWIVDTNYSGGNTYYSSSPINGTNDDTLYQSERWGGTINYTLSNLDNIKQYNVILHFAEIYWNSVGSRIFNVSINGSIKLSNYDILSEVPKFTTITKSYTVSPQNGNITITFTTVKDNAKISAIEIIEL